MVADKTNVKYNIKIQEIQFAKISLWPAFLEI